MIADGFQDNEIDRLIAEVGTGESDGRIFFEEFQNSFSGEWNDCAKALSHAPGFDEATTSSLQCQASLDAHTFANRFIWFSHYSCVNEYGIEIPN